MRLKLFTVACILFLAIGGAAAFGYWADTALGKKQTPEEVANLFLAAMAQNDFEKMRALSTKDSGETIDLLESLNSFGSSDGNSPQGDSWGKVTQCKEQKEVAKCEVCCNDEGNNSFLTLYKENGHWLVHVEK